MPHLPIDRLEGRTKASFLCNESVPVRWALIELDVLIYTACVIVGEGEEVYIIRGRVGLSSNSLNIRFARRQLLVAEASQRLKALRLAQGSKIVHSGKITLPSDQWQDGCAIDLGIERRITGC